MSGPAAAVLSPQKASPTRPISRVNERAFRDRLEPAEQAVFDACDANQRRRWMEGDILRSSLTAEERDGWAGLRELGLPTGSLEDGASGSSK